MSISPISAISDAAPAGGARNESARLLDHGRPPHHQRQGQHGLRLHSDPRFFFRRFVRPGWAGRSYQGSDDPQAPPYGGTPTIRSAPTNSAATCWHA